MGQRGFLAGILRVTEQFCCGSIRGKGAPGANFMETFHSGGRLSADDQPGGGSRAIFWIGLSFVASSAVCCVATFLVLTRMVPAPIPLEAETIEKILMLDAVLVLGAVGFTAWRAAGLWRAQQRTARASGLDAGVPLSFGVIAMLPPLLVTAMASAALERGLNVVFQDRTKAIMHNSEEVAKAYVNELVFGVRSDSVSLAKELEASASLLKEDQNRFQRLLKNEAAARRIQDAYLLDGEGRILLFVQGDQAEGYRPPPKEAYRIAALGKIVAIEPSVSGGKQDGAQPVVTPAAALKKLDNFENTYLYALRPLRPEVGRHLLNALIRATAYNTLKDNRT